MAAGVPVEPLARYFEVLAAAAAGRLPVTQTADVRCALLGRGDGGVLMPGDRVPLRGARAARRCALSGEALRSCGVGPSRRRRRAIGRSELEAVHRALIATHLEKDLKSARVLRELRGRRSIDGSDPTAVTLQDLIFKLSAVLGLAGLPDPAAARPRGRRRHVASRDDAARARAAPLERRLRAALAAAGRRAVRREPEPAVQAPPVPGDHEAGARRDPAALPAEPRGVRHRAAPARHPVRGGQLGVADARRLGHRLAGDARRPGDHPVHLLPAGGRHRPARRSRSRSPTASSASRCSCSGSTTSTTCSGRRA